MYRVKINWYDRYAEEDRIDNIIVVAGSWAAAMDELNKCFEYINSIEMWQIDSSETKIIYVTDEHMAQEIAELNVE